MAAYTINNQNAGTPQSITSATFKSLLSVSAVTGATTLRRGWIMEWEIGATDVPNATDCPILWDISEFTAVGTATALTPRVNDVGGGDAAALLVYSANATAEPTTTASSSAWFMGLNQRASYRVQMRDEFHALIIPAVTAKGLTLRAKSPNYASTCGARALIKE